jgi:3-dehydroquinate dehydratase-2
MKKIYVVNGPNLNLLGKREPEIYGAKSLADIQKELEESFASRGFEIIFYQSNHEGQIIDYIQELPENSEIVINPAGLSHSSVSLRDCIAGTNHKVIEVHITNIYARESFRNTSLISAVCRGVISGLGIQGYHFAIEALIGAGND